MQPLTQDDLLPLEEYAGRRREFFESHRRYVDRYRRVRVGPGVTLVFENRQTLWFRVQEIIRIARLADPDRLREELRLYNKLLPTRAHLHAAMLIEPESERALTDLQGHHVGLLLGRESRCAKLVTCRPEDRCAGMAQWVQFEVDEDARQRLADSRERASLAIDHPAYSHGSADFSEDVRQSLLDDLTLSDRDAA